MTEPELARLFYCPPHSSSASRRRFLFGGGRRRRRRRQVCRSACFLHWPPTATFADCLRLGDRRLAADYLNLVAFEGFDDDDDDGDSLELLFGAASALLAACFDARLSGEENNELLVQAWHFARRAEEGLAQDADATSTDDLATNFALAALLKRYDALGAAAATLAELSGYDPARARRRNLKRGSVDPPRVVDAALAAFPATFLDTTDATKEEEPGLDRLHAVARLFDLDAWALVLATALDGVLDTDAEPPAPGLAFRFATAFRDREWDAPAPIRRHVLATLDDLASREANAARKACVV
mmetsp:Transcript_27279/g.83743  ORF Transcript_27279/g.83743 Transcript_27279/m.83743 type:complete len:299 (-) Transcript_27279:106-1002(-)